MNERAMTPAENHDHQKIIKAKELRVEIQKLIEFLNTHLYKSRETDHTWKALKEARHWLGEELSRIGTPTPYPHGDDPTNTIVSPTADMPKQ